MVYQETYCSDAWISNATNINVTEEAIIEYFDESHRIKIEAIDIKVVNIGQSCKACHCLSGREVEVEVDEKFIPTMENEGFIRQ